MLHLKGCLQYDLSCAGHGLRHPSTYTCIPLHSTVSSCDKFQRIHSHSLKANVKVFSLFTPGGGGDPGQVQMGGTPARSRQGGTPTRSRWAVPQPGPDRGGGYPTRFRWGVPQPGVSPVQRWSTPPPPPRIRQQMEYLGCGGRYASCVHAGGLSCFSFIFAAARCEQQIGFPKNSSLGDVTFVQCEWTFNKPSFRCLFSALCFRSM